MESISGRTQDRVIAAKDVYHITMEGRHSPFDHEWRYQAVSHEFSGITSNVPPDVSVAGKDGENAECLDAACTDLDQTLRFLRETKTPMLPSRVRNGRDHSRQLITETGQTLGGSDGDTLTGRAVVESQRLDSDDVHLLTRLSDRCVDRAEVYETDSNSDTDSAIRASMVVEFSNGLYHEFSENASSRQKHCSAALLSTKHANQPSSSNLNNSQNVDLSRTNQRDDGNKLPVGSLMVGAGDRSSHSIPVDHSSAQQHLSSDINSLIARYQNLRASSDPVGQVSAAATTVLTPTVTETSISQPSTSAREMHAKTDNSFQTLGIPRPFEALSACHEPHRSTSTGIGCVLSSRMTEEDQALCNNNSKLLPPDINNQNRNLSFECGLDDDCFDDIRQNLVDISLDEGMTPVIPRLSKRDSSFLDISRSSFHSMPMSPLTDLVHRTGDMRSSLVVDPTAFEISTRLSTSLIQDDILREGGSLLMPTSPNDAAQTPPSKSCVQTATLIDLS
jgi:hypothetical protein